MNAPETQTYLDEANAPTVQASCRPSLKSFAPYLSDTADQLSRYARLLDAAVLSEPDEGLRQLLGEAANRVGATLVSQREAQRHLRDMAAREGAFREIMTAVKAQAKKLGYATSL